MTSALGHSTQVFNALTQDVNEIYSYKDQTTKKYVRIYSFEDNKVSIAFKRIWEGRAAACGTDMIGSAKITMQKRDPDLETSIIEIIQRPTKVGLGGSWPVVSSIKIK